MTNLFSWGERGLVSTFFNDISACKDMLGWEAFLDLIQFPRKGRKVRDVWALIEPDFGNQGFGHPDFVAKITFDGEPVPVIFVLEAKMRTFLKSSENIRNSKGFNSSLNGQLELNHRLTVALSECRTVTVPLTEPNWVSEFLLYLPVRYLKRTVVLEQVVNALRCLPLASYCHVIITADSDDPIDSVPVDRRPFIVNADKTTGWEAFRQRLFWASWKSLYELSSEWPVRSFRSNFDFMRCSQQMQGNVGVIPAARASRGVSLVRISQSFLPRPKPTFLYLSWRQPTGVRIYDFSGQNRCPVSMPLNRTLCDLFANIEEDRAMPGRKDCNDYKWWHARTMEANRSFWPQEWGVV